MEAGSDVEADCKITSHYWELNDETLYNSNDLYFVAKNKVNTNDEYSAVLYDGNGNQVSDVEFTDKDGNSYNAKLKPNSNVSPFALHKLQPGSYTYTLKIGSHTVCSVTATVLGALTCSVDKVTIGPGDSFVLNANYVGNCYNSTLTASPSSGSGLSSEAECQNKYTITPSSKGTYEYTYSVTKGSIGTASCENSVTVDDVAPSFSCANNLQATIGADNNVQIRLTGISGCPNDDACDYSISGTGSTATTYTGCSNASCTLPKITNKGKTNVGDTALYTVSLTNTVGTASHNCSVEFIEGVTISSKDVATDVDCGKSITVSTTTYQYNETWLHCTGSFDKTLDSYVAGPNNEAKVKVCDGHGYYGSETSCTGSFTTECLAGNTMSCTVGGP